MKRQRSSSGAELEQNTKRARHDDDNTNETTSPTPELEVPQVPVESTAAALTPEETEAKAKNEAQQILSILNMEQDRPDPSLVESVLNYASQILKKEPNLLELSSPITCVGDIHAEWYDLKKVFELAGSLESGSRFLFLGDYVDRGFYGVECLVTLAAKKILFPNDLFLIRGNHEDSMISSTYGHLRECEVYYTKSVYQASCEFFKALPLCATVDKKYFCCHGGVPNGLTLDKLADLQRSIAFVDTISQSAIADLLWSDPGEQEHAGVIPNFMRGCGSLFNERALDAFHHANDLQVTIRAHQLAKGGVFWQFNKKLCTVFSASDYCRQMGNDGGILLLSPTQEPKGLTWTSEEIGDRKKIFGREMVANLLFKAHKENEDSEDSSDEVFMLGTLYGESESSDSSEIRDEDGQDPSGSSESSVDEAQGEQEDDGEGTHEEEVEEGSSSQESAD